MNKGLSCRTLLRRLLCLYEPAVADEQITGWFSFGRRNSPYQAAGIKGIRTSIAWTRILPNSDEENPNEEGVGEKIRWPENRLIFLKKQSERAWQRISNVLLLVISNQFHKNFKLSESWAFIMMRLGKQTLKVNIFIPNVLVESGNFII